MNDMEMEDNDLNNIARQICETDEDHQKDDNRQVMHLLEVDGSSAISDSENDKLPKQPTISNLSQPLKDPDCISKSSNSTHNVLGNCQLSCRSSFSRWPQSIIENEHSCLEQHKPLTDHLVSDESIQRMCQEEEQEEKCVIPEVDSVNLIITPELNDPSQAALLEKENDVEGTPADYFDVRSSNHDLWSFDVTAEVNTTVVISSTEEQDATDPSHQSVHNIEDGQSNDTSNRQERNDDLAGSNIINDFSENEQKERKEIIIKRSVNLNSTLEQNDEQGQLPDASDIQPSSGKIDDNRDESLRRDNDILGFLNTSIHEEEKENNSMTRQDDPFGQCQHLMSSIKKKKHKSSTIIEEEERQDSDVISQDDSVDQCEHPASRIMKKGRRRRKSIYVRCGKKKYIKSSSFGVEEAGQLDETNAALDLDGSVQKHDVGDVGDHVVEERRSTSTYSCPKETDESQLSWLEEVNDVDGASAVMDNSRVASLASTTSPSESAGLSLDANTSALLNNGIDEKEREDSDVISQDNSVDLCEHPASRIMKKGRRRRKSIYVRCGKKKYVKSSSFGVEEAGQLDETNAALDLDGSVQKHDVGDVGDHVVEERRSTSTYSCPKEQPFCNLENKWNKHERNIISPRHRRKKYMELDPHIEGEYVQLDKENAVNDLSGNVKCLSEIINIYSPKGDGRHVSVLKEISNTEVTPEDGHDAGAGPHGRCYKSTVTYRQYSKDSSNQSSAEQNYIEFDVTFSEGDMSSTVDDNLICMNSLLTVESLVLPFPDEPLPLVKKEHSLADEHKEDCVQGIGRKKKKYKRRQSSDSEEINTSAVFKTPKDLKRRRSLRLYYKSLDSCQSEDSYTEKHDNQRCDNNSHEFNSAVDEETLKDGKDAVDNTAASESILSHEHANESQESSQNNTRESEEKSTELQQLEESVTGKTRRQNRSNKQESVNDVYLNKLWKSQMPILKGWETIYEQPNIGRGGNGMLMSKKRLMRSINFEEFYTKKRLNRRHKKAVKLGWKPPTADQNEKALALLAEKLLTLEKDLEETAENNLF